MKYNFVVNLAIVAILVVMIVMSYIAYLEVNSQVKISSPFTLVTSDGDHHTCQITESNNSFSLECFSGNQR